jgi:type III restriction enzyme
MNLLARDCDVRYIITKQALQEGWDCSFAYVLAALTKSQSETAMTQLIGRVLRQPYAVKTGVPELDECYVYSFQHDTAKLVGGIKKNLEGEGLGDVVGRIDVDSDDAENPDYEPERTLKYRDEFKKFEGSIYLPMFAIQEGKQWRELSYESDLLAKINWSDIDLSSLDDLALENSTVDEEIRALGFGAAGELHTTARQEKSYVSELSDEYITRQIVSIVPNPWAAFDIARAFLDHLGKRYDKEIIATNLVYAVERLKVLLSQQRDVLSEVVFRDMLAKGLLRFYLLKGVSNAVIPRSITMRTKRRLVHADGEQVQISLFDYVPAENVNGLEEEVALYLDRQQELLWWYRNMANANYRIQGWKPNRVYPDFLGANKINGTLAYDKVYVLETKGEHLAGNEDTDYKRTLLKLCNELAIEKSWLELNLGFENTDFVFEMIDQDGWKSQLNNII